MSDYLDQIKNSFNNRVEEEKSETLYDSVSREADRQLPQGGQTVAQAAQLAALSEDDKLRLKYSEQISQSDDPEGEWAKIQGSQYMAQITGDNADAILENYDQYTRDYFGDDAGNPMTNLQALKAAWDSGMLDLKIGKLSWDEMEQFINTGSADESTAQQIADLETSRPAEDSVRRGFGIKALKLAIGLMPIMGDSALKGLVAGATMAPGGAAVGSLIPGAGTLAGAGAAFMAGRQAGSMMEIGKIEAGLAWREMDGLTNEAGEAIDPNVRFWAAMAVGGGNAALESSIMSKIGDSLGLPSAILGTVRGAAKRGIARAVKSDAYRSVIRGVTTRIIANTAEETGQEILQQVNNILWREVAIEVTNSTAGTHLDHATRAQLIEELKQTAVQSAIGMGTLGLATGAIGAPIHIARAKSSLERTNRFADKLTEAGYDVAAAEGDSIEEKVKATLNQAREDVTGQTSSTIATQFTTNKDGDETVFTITGTNTDTGKESGRLDFVLDDEGLIHVIGAEYSGRSLEAREIYKELVKKSGGMEVAWDVEGGAQAKSVQDAFTEENFTIDYGEDSTFTDLKVTDRDTFRDSLARAFPEFKDEEIDTAVKVLEQRAVAAGMSADEFIKKYIHEDAFVAGVDMKARDENGNVANVRGAHQILQEGKAVFYFGKSAGLT